MLGKLATYLRMCGYDAAYGLDRGIEADDRLLDIAADEGRVLLTRDRQLAARAPRSVLLRSREVDDQLRELRDANFDLSMADRQTRCGSCNGRLDPVDSGGFGGSGREIPEYAPDPGKRAVWRCRECGQYFWKGSHWDDVARRLDEL